MRRILALGSWLIAVGGCFEESDPVDETGANPSSGEECTPGTESCPCIDGGCVNDLVCLSNVCVDAGSTSATTEDPETTSATSGPSTTSVDTTPMTSTSGPLDEGPVTSDSSGGLPAGAPCDPFVDECQAGLACVGIDMAGLVCDVPGEGAQYDDCQQATCGAGLLCIQADAVGMCNSMVACCTTMCDVNDGGMGACPTGLVCEPFYPPMQAPPGYEAVGICVTSG